MDNLEFRKFLTSYGIGIDEYNEMDESEKGKLKDKFNKSEKEKSTNETREALKKTGEGLQGCGCLIMLVPLLLLFIFFIIATIF